MTSQLSLTEENYIKAIYQISLDPTTNVSTNALADNMQTKPATVSDMIKKLSKKKLLIYEKYKGVSLSKSGLSTALTIVRKHRLWEVFLVNHLNFKWDEVHEIAEQLEHIISPELVERLDRFLGNPRIDPHGDPIPDINGNFHCGPTHLLSELAIMETGVIIGVKNDDPLLLQYLDKVNIRLGLKIKILEINTYDGSVKIEINEVGKIFLSEKITSQLLISKTS
jgi:DtxR family transcriptional regulator, Mn-dependent transcriptional regulator|tara:strand:+ start:8145 stop:8816 length:672 start_codon:yes stop_codon:yes gene_type:complete